MGPAVTIKAPDKIENLKFVRSARIAKLRELVRPRQPELDLERLRYMTASYKETEGQSPIIRRAKALDKILSEMTIYILDGELIVGNQSRSPMAAMMPCEYGAEWLLRDLDTFGTREQDRFVVKEEEKAETRELLSYWIGKTVDARVLQMLTPIAKAIGHEVVPGGAFMGIGHVTVDFGKIINKGVKGIKKEIEDRVKRLDPWNPDDFLKYETYDAMNITLDAFVKFAHRYAEFARELASKEKDPQRKQELEQIASNCEWVPENPARTFWEALQTMWFVEVVITLEGLGYGYQPGRMDQYLYPYYRKDIDEGRMSKDWAQELLEACFCKFQETTVLLPSMPKVGDWVASQPAGLAGLPVTQNIVIGGTTADGKDASNELSHLIMDADMSVRLAQPELAVRLHKGTPDEFLRHVAEYVKCGTGKPKMFVDETVYRMYQRYREFSDLNVAKEDLWDYCPAGCIEHHIGGKTANNEHTTGACFDFGAPLQTPALMLALHQGKSMGFGGLQIGLSTPDPRTFSSFDQLMDVYKQQAYALGRLNILPRIVEDEAFAELTPTPFQSTLLSDCIEKGLDATRGGARYNMIQGGNMGLYMGLVNEANGLAVIKKLVFEDKAITMDDLLKAMDNNWEGYEDLHQMVLNRVPKFGNDDDYVDSIMQDILNINSAEALKYRTLARKAVFASSVSSATGNVLVGKMVPASPDGRYAGTPVADGGVSPHLGTDRNGPTAILNSVCKLDSSVCAQGTLWNIKFSGQALQGERGLTNLVNWLRTFINSGGYHVQINCLDNKTLRDAQKHPENYRNLLVRIAGYSAFFTQIDKDSQDMLIARTEHQGV